MAKYQYQVVTPEAVWSKEPTTMVKAKALCALLRSDRHPHGPRPDAEIERVQQISESVRKYWIWRDLKWRPFDASTANPRDLARWNI